MPGWISQPVKPLCWVSSRHPDALSTGGFQALLCTNLSASPSLPSEHFTIFRQSSTYVQMNSDFGLMLQIQTQPILIVYMYAAIDLFDTTKGEDTPVLLLYKSFTGQNLHLCSKLGEYISLTQTAFSNCAVYFPRGAQHLINCFRARALQSHTRI